MAKYIVIAPTNVMPEAPGLIYAEGKEFEVDERKPEIVLWVAAQLKVGVIAKEGSAEYEAWQAIAAPKEAARKAKAAKSLTGLKEDTIEKILVERGHEPKKEKPKDTGKGK